MRLFIAIDPPLDALARLQRLVTSLRPEALIKWTPLDNLHITVKFIGQWEDARLNEIDDALQTVASREPFGVELKTLGWFPNERRPHTFWVGVESSAALPDLARDLEICLEKIGIAREDRAFTPHLTLARIKHPVPLVRLRQRVEGLQSTGFGEFRVGKFTLYRSRPGSNSSIYHKLRDYSFQSAMAAS